MYKKLSNEKKSGTPTTQEITEEMRAKALELIKVNKEKK